MNKTVQDQLVNIHNQYRSDIALGKYAPYQQAANMATMKWNDVLADLCVYNVKQCAMTHDESDCIQTGIHSI